MSYSLAEINEIGQHAPGFTYEIPMVTVRAIQLLQTQLGFGQVQIPAPFHSLTHLSAPPTQKGPTQGQGQTQGQGREEQPPRSWGDVKSTTATAVIAASATTPVTASAAATNTETDSKPVIRVRSLRPQGAASLRPLVALEPEQPNSRLLSATTTATTTTAAAATTTKGPMDLVRMHLKKITGATFLDVREKVMELLQTQMQTMSENDQQRMFDLIYNISSNNITYATEYADLFAEICTRFPSMRDQFFASKIDDNAITVAYYITAEEYVDSKEYDKFCEYNEANDKRKALATFFLHLAKNQFLSSAIVLQHAEILLRWIANHVTHQTMIHSVDNWVELLSIYVSESDGHTFPTTTRQTLQALKALPRKECAGMSARTYFKLKDMLM